MAELERRLAAAPEPVRAAAPAAGFPEEPGSPPPGEAEEAAFLAEAGARGGDPVMTMPEPPPGEAAAAPAAPEAPLPALDELVARIPAEVRATLDELFRARFSDVRRAREKDLKTSV
jgi:hypothetical protein